MATYIEVVDFKEFEEIHTHKLKANAKMAPENDVIVQVDNVHYVFGVVFLEELQNLKLYTSLVIVLLLVLDHLYGDVDARLVIEALHGRAE